MRLDVQKHDIQSSSTQSLDGSFRKLRSDARKNDLESSSAQSLDGSFRKPGFVASLPTTSSNSRKFVPTSERVYKVLKEYATKLLDLNLFTQCLEDWVLENLHPGSINGERHPKSPFQIDELCSLDFALEGVLFQQLFHTLQPWRPFPAKPQHLCN